MVEHQPKSFDGVTQCREEAMSATSDETGPMRERPARTLLERLSGLLTAIGWARLLG
jgi:hypothetical protein